MEKTEREMKKRKRKRRASSKKILGDLPAVLPRREASNAPEGALSAAGEEESLPVGEPRRDRLRHIGRG